MGNVNFSSHRKRSSIEFSEAKNILNFNDKPHDLSLMKNTICYNFGTTIFSTTIIMKNTLLLILSITLCSASFAQQWTKFDSPPEVSDIAVDAQGRKWVTSQAEGVYVLGGGTQIQYNSFSTDLPTNALITVAIDHNGIKWFGSSQGLTRFDGSVWTTYKTQDGLANNYVQDIAVDAQNNLWIATKGGVSTFDGTVFTNYTTTNSGLAGNNVRCVTVDGFGNKWFGTAGSGVSFFYGTGWTNYNTGNSGLNADHIYAIGVDAQGSKWIGSSAGLARLNPLGVWNSFNVQGAVASVLVDSQNRVWFGTEQGVTSFDGVNMTTFDTANSEIASSWVLAIAEEPGCGMWFGGPYGVSAYGNCLMGVAEYITGTANAFPNPATDVVTVTLPGAVSQTLTVSVFDYQGRLLQVHKTPSTNGTFTTDLTHLPAGLYTLKTESGKGIWISRIIKR